MTGFANNEARLAWIQKIVNCGFDAAMYSKLYDSDLREDLP